MTFAKVQMITVLLLEGGMLGGNEIDVSKQNPGYPRKRATCNGTAGSRVAWRSESMFLERAIRPTRSSNECLLGEILCGCEASFSLIVQGEIFPVKATWASWLPSSSSMSSPPNPNENDISVWMYQLESRKGTSYATADCLAVV